MKKRLLHSAAFLLVLSICISGCTNDEKDDTPDFSIVGEWFADNNTSIQMNLRTLSLTDSGDFSYWNSVVSRGLNNTEKWEGSYTYNSGNLSIIYSELGSNARINSNWRVNNVGKYEMDVFDTSSSTTIKYHKIVTTFNMAVGESKNFHISDAEYSPVTFKSSNEKVATVNSSGIIKAIKRGTSYIRSIAPIGEAVIRIIVTDPNNVVDEYEKYIGLNYMNVVNDYGRISLEGQTERGYSILKYDVLDDIAKQVNFRYWGNNRINRIIVQFQDDVEISKIIKSFDSKYDKLSSKDEKQHFYRCFYGDEVIDIDINEEFRGIYYVLKPNAYEEFDYAIMLNLDQLFEEFKIDYTYDELKNRDNFILGVEDHELFDNLIVNYDPITLEITDIRLRGKDGLATKDIEDWYKNHYYTTGKDNFPYGSNAVGLKCDYNIGIFEQKNHVYVWYSRIIKRLQ